MSSAVVVMAEICYLVLSWRFYGSASSLTITGGRLFIAVDGVALTILILNASGWLFEPGFKAWLLVVMWNMFGAIVGFVRLIYAQWEFADE